MLHPPPPGGGLLRRTRSLLHTYNTAFPHLSRRHLLDSIKTHPRAMAAVDAALPPVVAASI